MCLRVASTDKTLRFINTLFIRSLFQYGIFKSRGAKTPEVSSIKQDANAVVQSGSRAMSAVTFDGAVVERRSHQRYLGVHFGRMLTHRLVVGTALKFKKGRVSKHGA